MLTDALTVPWCLSRAMRPSTRTRMPMVRPGATSTLSSVRIPAAPSRPIRTILKLRRQHRGPPATPDPERVKTSSMRVI